MMTQMSYPYNDRIGSRSYNSVVYEGEDLGIVSPSSRSYFPPQMSLQLDVAHANERCPRFDPSLPHHGGHISSYSPYPLCFPLPEVNMSSSDDSTEYGDIGFHSPKETYHGLGSFYSSSDLAQNSFHTVSPPVFRLPSPGLALHCNTLGQKLPKPTGNDQIIYVDDPLQIPSSYLHTEHWVRDFDPSIQSNVTPQQNTNMLEASYPCLWTEGGVVCNVTVQATRSHMNRHLHAYHGFGGTDTRQTRCCWPGCGETMQQGSIARHMVTCHLQAKVTCPTCSKKLSRQDVISKHQRVCPAASAWR